MHNPTLPTFLQCLWLMGRAGKFFKGGWQRALLLALCAHRHIIIRGPRQNSGKTFCTAVYVATAIAKGNKVVIGMPTMRQGQHILSNLIGELVKAVEGPSLVRKQDNVLFKSWSNGAFFVIVSTDESAKGGVQGYTCDLLVIDEAHEASEITYEKLEPAISVAEVECREKTVLIGIGGDGSEHLIAKKKAVKLEDGETPLYHYHLITPEEIIETAEPEHREGYRSFFAKKKATLSPRSYAQNIMCEDWAEGKRRIFPTTRAEATGDADNGRLMYFHGIDVGKVDYTAIATFRCNVTGTGFQTRLLRAEWVNTEFLHGMDYVPQAREIIRYINDPRWGVPQLRPRYNFAVERNAPGDVLVDVIKELGLDDVCGSWTNQKFKQDAVDTFNRGFRHGWLGVPHETTLDHISRLNYELIALPGGGTKTEYDHSDVMSAGLVGVMLLPPIGFEMPLDVVRRMELPVAA